jgi:hypothetical protein
MPEPTPPTQHITQEAAQQMLAALYTARGFLYAVEAQEDGALVMHDIISAAIAAATGGA